MRKTFAVVVASLALAACGGGSLTDAAPATEPTVAGTTDTAPQTTTEASQDESAQVVTSLCDQYCEQLKQGGNAACPPPLNDLKVCADYLTPLVSAVSDINAQIKQLEFAARDYADLLEAAQTVLDSSESFAADRCYEITDSATQPGGFACALNGLALATNISTVGLRLQIAAEDV